MSRPTAPASRLGTLAALVAACLLSAPVDGEARSAAAAGPVEQILFDGAADPGYFSYRVPALVAFRSRADGADVVIAFAEARKQCGRDAGDIDVVMRASRDGGRTWSNRRILAGRRRGGEPDRGTWGNPTVVHDRQTGTVWLFVNYNAADRAQFPCEKMCSAEGERRCRSGRLETEVRAGDRRVFVMHSDDEGRRWSKPRDVTEAVQYPGTAWDAVGPGNGIQLSGRCGRGALIVPAIGRNIYSTDHGRRWQAGPRLPGGTSEATLVELSDGTLLRNDRPATRAMAAQGRRPVSVSRDCGETWTAWGYHPELATTRVHASLIRLDSVWRDILVFANPSSTERRERMTIRVSEDGGRTWPYARQLHAGTAGYASLAELPDRSIGLLYEQGRNRYDEHGAIAFFKAPLGWLQEPAGESAASAWPAASGVETTGGRTSAGESSPGASSSWSNPDEPASPAPSTGSRSSTGSRNIEGMPWLRKSKP